MTSITRQIGMAAQITSLGTVAWKARLTTWRQIGFGSASSVKEVGVKDVT
jgi:hypothetical protein